MKTKMLFFSILISICAPAVAQVIDITDHPNKSFFVGYDRVYKRFDDGSVCSASYAQLRSGHEQIALNVLCDGLGITKERIYDDLMMAMKYVDEHSSAKSFAEYFQMTRYTHFTDEPKTFCIFRSTTEYVFTDVKSPNSPGWRYIYASHDPFFGLWRVDSHGNVISKTHLNNLHPQVRRIDMSQASDCRTLKPYEPGLLLPSD